MSTREELARLTGEAPLLPLASQPMQDEPTLLVGTKVILTRNGAIVATDEEDLGTP